MDNPRHIVNDPDLSTLVNQNLSLGHTLLKHTLHYPAYLPAYELIIPLHRSCSPLIPLLPSLSLVLYSLLQIPLVLLVVPIIGLVVSVSPYLRHVLLAESRSALRSLSPGIVVSVLITVVLPVRTSVGRPLLPDVPSSETQRLQLNGQHTIPLPLKINTVLVIRPTKHSLRDIKSTALAHVPNVDLSALPVGTLTRPAGLLSTTRPGWFARSLVSISSDPLLFESESTCPEVPVFLNRHTLSAPSKLPLISVGKSLRKRLSMAPLSLTSVDRRLKHFISRPSLSRSAFPTGGTSFVIAPRNADPFTLPLLTMVTPRLCST